MPFSPLPRHHEQSWEVIPCLHRSLSRAKKLIEQKLPELLVALRWPRSYVHIDYCMGDCQGLEDTRAEPHLFEQVATEVDRLFHCHLWQTTSSLVCSVSQ